MIDLEELWKEAKSDDGGLPNDGDYFGILNKVQNKETEKGHQILELEMMVDEGEAEGRLAKQSIFYSIPDNRERSKMGMKTIFTLYERLDPVSADSASFQTALTGLQSALGKKVRFSQKTSESNGKKYKNIYLRDFIDDIPY